MDRSACTDLAHTSVVVERKPYGVARLVEREKKTVGMVNFSATMFCQKVASSPVMPRENLRGADVSQLVDKPGRLSTKSIKRMAAGFSFPGTQACTWTIV